MLRIQIVMVLHCPTTLVGVKKIVGATHSALGG